MASYPRGLHLSARLAVDAYSADRCTGFADRNVRHFPLLGFSINTLSLFGLVLAIGLVVDDAIVVVEAMERHIEEGLSPRDAALRQCRRCRALSWRSR